MAIRFSHGDIKMILKRLGYKKARKDSYIYIGISINGDPTTVRFDYHKDHDLIATGTGKQISKSLGFENTMEMQEFLNNKGKK